MEKPQYGDFAAIPFHKNDGWDDILDDMLQTAHRMKLEELLATTDYEWFDERYKPLMDNLKLRKEHCGGTLICCLHHIQIILKEGWDKYLEEMEMVSAMNK